MPLIDYASAEGDAYHRERHKEFFESPELTEAWLKPGQDVALKGFFKDWIKAWEGKDLETYISLYHSDFVAQGMHRDQWKAYKKNLNGQYATIHIGPEDVKYYRHPKYSMVTFTQNYYSTLAVARAFTPSPVCSKTRTCEPSCGTGRKC